MASTPNDISSHSLTNTVESTWTSHIFNSDSILPRPGEVIKIRCSIAMFDFKYGPCSDGSLGSFAPTPSSAARRLKKPVYHHVIVSAVSASSAGDIVIQFFPIISYSNPPPSFTGSDWDPAVWMQGQAEETTIKHLPVPAVDWGPAPPSLWGKDPLDFGNWRNSRPAWVTIVLRMKTIPGTETWKRLSPSVHLSETDLATLRGFEAAAGLYLLARNSIVTTSYATIPNYDDVWTGILAGASSRYDDNKSDGDSDSEDEYDGVGDNTDPISFWRFGGAPKEMREMVEWSDKIMMERWKQGINRWVQGVEDLVCEEEMGKVVNK